MRTIKKPDGKTSGVAEYSSKIFVTIAREIARSVGGRFRTTRLALSNIDLRFILVGRDQKVSFAQVRKLERYAASRGLTLVLTDWYLRDARELTVMNSANRFDALLLLEDCIGQRRAAGLRKVLLSSDKEVGARIVRLIPDGFLEVRLSKAPTDPLALAGKLRRVSGAVTRGEQECELARDIAKKAFVLSW
jgi:hypothetical protein